jgi:hypothetical protein
MMRYCKVGDGHVIFLINFGHGFMILLCRIAQTLRHGNSEYIFLTSWGLPSEFNRTL